MSLGLVGSRLGRYEILSEIGQGGMSIVYRARDSQLEREVAIKVMHTFLAEQPEARGRFRREAIAVARLRHPHIIEIYDYSGEDASQSYIVTELVEGSSLATVLGSAPMTPPEAALVIGRAIVDALVHAHAHGVVHRDLKPENILIGKDGSLKLTDFGIARMLDNQTLTVTGTLLGSPAYMAPEYIDGADTDARADIYSFGAMLYQFLTGRLPFEAQTPHALLKRIVTGEHTPPEQRNPKVHAAIARIVRRALARDPAARFQSATELRDAIDAVLARVDLDAAAERPLLLGDPHRGPALESELLPRYVAAGKRALAAKRVGVALEDFDRVLSIDPQHREVRRIVHRLARRALRGRIVRDAAIALAGAAIVTVAVGTLLDRWPRPATPAPAAPAAVVDTAPREAERNVIFIPTGAGDLFVDGALVARSMTDPVPYLLAPGEHEVRYVGPAGEDQRRFTVPAVGPVPPVRIEARPPESPDDPPRATTPARRRSKQVEFRIAGGLWVNVYVDDQQLMSQHIGPVSLTLPYGRHRVRFSNPCCEPREIEVAVSDTEPPEMLEGIELRPNPARLFIDGAPAGARIEVAGKLQRLTPGDPVFVPMTTRGSAEFDVVVTYEGRVLLSTRTRFEPGREQRLAVAAPAP